MSMVAGPAVLVAMKALACLACMAMVVLSAQAEENSSRAPPEVTIGTGRLSGKWMTTRDGRDIAAFLGIPYAAAPVGELRFAPPQPAKSWSGVRDAFAPGSMCIQRNLYFRIQEIQGSEDCLFVNVYAPEDVSRTEPLPVLFWVHGGGWLSGAGSVYTPEFLLDQDVILVTFNYRLGPLGFLSTGDAVIPGNNGLKDIVFALRWVRDNVRTFGGDQDSITVIGQSAGAATAHLLTLSPMAKGLFHRAVAMSGCAFTQWAFHMPTEAQARARVLAAHTDCPDAPSDALLRCLRTKTAEEIVGVDRRFQQWDIHPHMPFKATAERGVDAPFLDLHPREAYGAGYLQDSVPLMTGITAQEGGVVSAVLHANATSLKELNDRFIDLSTVVFDFARYPEPMRIETFKRLRQFYFGDGPVDKDAEFNLIDMYTDAFFLYPIVDMIKVHKRHSKAPVFFYELAHLSQSHRSFIVPFGAPSPDYGVCHSDDLMYLFPMTEALPGELATDDVYVSRKFIDFIVRFARTGRPTPDRTWQEVAHPDSAEYMHIGSPGDIEIRANIASKRMKLWSEVPIQTGRVSAPHDEL